MTALEIRKATMEDIPAMSELLTTLFTQESDFSPNPELQVMGLKAIVQNPAIGTILVAEINGKVIGMVNLLYTISTARGGKVALLEDMIISEENRSFGAGSALLWAAINAATAEGCLRITLLTDIDNAKAISFYMKHGFQRTNMTPLRMHLDVGI